MPYIKQKKREDFAEMIVLVSNHIKDMSVAEQDGALNYFITKLLHEIYGPKYFNYNRALGVLEAIKLEYYRRVVAPYEDLKIEMEGDV